MVILYLVLGQSAIETTWENVPSFGLFRGCYIHEYCSTVPPTPSPTSLWNCHVLQPLFCPFILYFNMNLPNALETFQYVPFMFYYHNFWCCRGAAIHGLDPIFGLVKKKRSFIHKLITALVALHCVCGKLLM